MDRRVERTRRALREALLGLIHEKPYDNIVVKEILARANVGRSTFYAHFKDKAELLASCVHEILASVYPSGAAMPSGRGARVLGFSLPLLELHERHRTTAERTIDPATRTALHQRFQQHLATRLVTDFQRGSPSGEPLASVGAGLLAEYVASTFGLVLERWLESHSGHTPREVDAQFQSLVRPTLDSLVGTVTL